MLVFPWLVLWHERLTCCCVHPMMNICLSAHREKSNYSINTEFYVIKSLFGSKHNLHFKNMIIISESSLMTILIIQENYW